ncbi:hypothetical protein [Streptomyces sp. NPDC001828]|uniref:hypothetical protein n=1 Tax=Streptomyces sp. NPDC001828 TaxID=3364615 RepID=UPI0036CB76AD
MTGEPQSPAPLTDEQRVTQQVAVTDIATATATALSRSFPSGGRAVFSGARTDFEGHRLNEMLDLVHPAQPGHLLDAGHALRAARGAIDAAAAELDGHIANVEWEGESGEAFRTWGKNLATHARKLADFAGTAGVQISAAGEGLVSVKSALPPRDHRADPVRVTDIPPMRRVAGNAEYEAAVRVEKDRQEAINQLNRLSSFYTVSQQNLASLEAPVFEVMPGVGVPKPRNWYGGDPTWPCPERTANPPSERMAPMGQSDSSAVSHARVETADGSGETRRSTHRGFPGGSPVSMEIDSGPPLLDTAPERAAMAPPPVVPVTPGVTTALLAVNSQFGPAVHSSGRAVDGEHGAGTTEPPNGPASAAGRGSVDPVRRVGPSGPEFTRSGSRSAVGEPPMRRGVSVGTPRVGGPVGPKPETSGASGSVRNGIVGGRPNFGAQGSAGSQRFGAKTAGSYETSSQPFATGRPSQGGVVGANEPSVAGEVRKGGRVKANVDGVVGVPQGRSAGKHFHRSRFTSGGSGLVRGSREEQILDDEDDET